MLLRLVALILVLFTASAAHAQSFSESFSIVVTRADGSQECRPACAGSTVVAVPELSILRSLTKHIGGRHLHAALNPTLQRVTTWGAAKLLRAPHDGDRIFLPSVTLRVEQRCSGIAAMKWLLLLGVGLVIVGSRRFSMASKIMLIAAAPLIAIECNIARVAATGAGIEWLGHASRGAIKEWTGWGAVAFGVAQVVGLGLLVNRPVRSH